MLANDVFLEEGLQLGVAGVGRGNLQEPKQQGSLFVVDALFEDVLGDSVEAVLNGAGVLEDGNVGTDERAGDFVVEIAELAALQAGRATAESVDLDVVTLGILESMGIWSWFLSFGLGRGSSGRGPSLRAGFRRRALTPAKRLKISTPSLRPLSQWNQTLTEWVRS